VVTSLRELALRPGCCSRSTGASLAGPAPAPKFSSSLSLRISTDSCTVQSPAQAPCIFPSSSAGHTAYRLHTQLLLASPADLSKKLRNHTAANIASIISSIAKAIVPAVHRASDFRVVQEGDGEDTGTEPERSAGTLSHVGNRDKGKGKGKAREGLYGEGVIGTGDAGLDRALGGGLRLGTMAEISGER
jgi:hypothetical protein